MLQVDSIRPDDTKELLRLARVNGQPTWQLSPGAWGYVVRDGDAVRALCLIREMPYGFVIDDVWGDRGRRGTLGVAMLIDFCDRFMQRLADVRQGRMKIGGIVRLDNPAHKAALQKRGCSVIAEVLSKTYEPQLGQAVG